jgi:hypothetical protein
MSICIYLSDVHHSAAKIIQNIREKGACIQINASQRRGNKHPHHEHAHLFLIVMIFFSAISLSIIILTDFIDPTEAGFTVGLEEECKQLAKEVIELLALVRVHLAFRTSVITIIQAASAYLAPCCFLI